jgi:hypothetical protein
VSPGNLLRRKVPKRCGPLNPVGNDEREATIYERHDPNGYWSVETTDEDLVTVEVQRITMTEEEAGELSKALADAVLLLAEQVSADRGNSVDAVKVTTYNAVGAAFLQAFNLVVYCP